ncbi:MAG: nicotinate-nucleotide adenylyltransferase [Gammaproteobacteria bacterium]|nr:nicotinate-nucleotide adenylyltransferase [Gammaproteobacteria bacterium]
MTAVKPIGLLGGAFDPIHYGHLRLALDFLQILDLKEVRFIPCKSPVLKEATLATPEQRLALLRLAITPVPQFRIDDREIKRDSPSYMIETVKSLRKEFSNTPLCLLLGSDAFLKLDEWKEWQKLLDYVHIVVGLRAGTPFLLNEVLSDFISQHQLNDTEDLHQQLHGGIYIQNISQLTISASDIRSQIAAHLDVRFLLPDNVYQYIQQHQLYGYTHDI